MQFRLIPALVLFLGSYFPLAIILLVQDVKREYWGRPICTSISVGSCDYQLLDHPWIGISVALISGIAVFSVVRVLGAIRLRFDAEVLESKLVPNELINYVFPYVVSFMGLNYASPASLAGFLVFLFLMFAITYKSGQIVMNPLLLLFGWRLYDVKIKIEKQERLVRAFSKEKVVPGTYRYEVVQDVYFMGEA